MCEGGSYVLWSEAAGAGAAGGRLLSTSCQGRLIVSAPRRSWGGLSSVTGSHSFSPAPFFHSLLFSFILPTSSPLPHLISPQTLSSSPCSQSQSQSSGHVPCSWPQRLAVFLRSSCLVSDLYSSYRVLSCHLHGKPMTGWLKCRKLVSLAGSSN